MASKRSSGKSTPTPQLPLKGGKKGQKKETIVCPICDEVIVDPVGSKPGDDSIYCDGDCSSWLHRRCAGLSKSVFASLTKSDNPFHCPRCILSLHEKEICSLKSMVATLTSHLSLLSDNLEVVKEEIKKIPSGSSSTSNVPTHAKSYATAVEGSERSGTSSNVIVRTQQQKPTGTDVDRKFNVVLHNVEESHEGTPRSQREADDLKKVVAACSSVSDSITSEGIRDLFRLGKYNKDRQRPRPLLVKFVRSTDARAVLSKSSNLTPPIIMKPDLSPAARKRESILLKARWKLLEQGIAKSRVRIRYDSIYLDNVLYGKVDSSNTFKLADASSATSKSTRHQTFVDQNQADHEDNSIFIPPTSSTPTKAGIDTLHTSVNPTLSPKSQD